MPHHPRWHLAAVGGGLETEFHMERITSALFAVCYAIAYILDGRDTRHD